MTLRQTEHQKYHQITLGYRNQVRFNNYQIHHVFNSQNVWQFWKYSKHTWQFQVYNYNGDSVIVLQILILKIEQRQWTNFSTAMWQWRMEVKEFLRIHTLYSLLIEQLSIFVYVRHTVLGFFSGINNPKEWHNNCHSWGLFIPLKNLKQCMS